jgi:threonine dehydrogenase-like Zn-dependent dehydrogenase
MLLGTTRGLGGSWGEQYVAHEDQLVHVPDFVSDSLALLTEPFACAVSPVLERPPAPGSRALVIGAGSVGLLTLAALRMLTDAEVTVLARHGFQREHAERIGAHHVVMQRGGDYFPTLSRIAGGRLIRPILGRHIHVGGFDATFVCVGGNAAMEDALRFTRSGGEITLLANVARLARIDWTPVWLKEISLHGSLCYHGASHGGAKPGAFETAARLLATEAGRSLEALVSHVVPLEDFDHALALALGRRGSHAVKVALRASV